MTSSAPTTTPLLLLLDSILSQDAERILRTRQAVYRIVMNAKEASSTTRHRAAAVEAAALIVDDTATRSAAQQQQHPSSCTLLRDVDMILATFPSLASIASAHDGSLPLHFASSIGNVGVAARILSQYPTAASTPNAKGKIPLHFAAREGRSDMVAYFLRATPETAKIASKKKKLALHFAAGDGHIDVVRQLLRVYPEGASLPSKKGKLPLHFAARWEHMQIASDLLFVHPEGVRCVDWDGSLPLHDAAREGQLVMSKFLIERYPNGLSIANIRGETPLFPAVRSGNVNLVILYLQGWALGGKHLLRAVSEDDNFHEWDWDIVELCLRGAVDNFSECALVEGKDPPAILCTVGQRDVGTSRLGAKALSGSACKGAEACCQPPQKEDETASSATANLNSTYESAVLGAASMPAPVPQSMHPILKLDGYRSKKRSSTGLGSDRKRSRSASWNDFDASGGAPLEQQQRKFMALHAALECEASSHVIKCVMAKHANQISESDERGRFPLHIAVRHPACSTSTTSNGAPPLEEEKRTKITPGDKETTINMLLADILKPYPDAALVLDSDGWLPLYHAIESRANSVIIKELIRIHPSSAVDPVPTAIAQHNNKPPIYMATASDCDLSTVYLLLRAEPSVVPA